MYTLIFVHNWHYCCRLHSKAQLQLQQVKVKLHLAAPVGTKEKERLQQRDRLKLISTRECQIIQLVTLSMSMDLIAQMSLSMCHLDLDLVSPLVTLPGATCQGRSMQEFASSWVLKDRWLCVLPTCGLSCFSCQTVALYYVYAKLMALCYVCMPNWWLAISMLCKTWCLCYGKLNLPNILSFILFCQPDANLMLVFICSSVKISYKIQRNLCQNFIHNSE